MCQSLSHPTRSKWLYATASFLCGFFFAFLASWREILYWIAVSENALAQQIVDAAYRVHTTLGPGLLESVYRECLLIELRQEHLRVESELQVALDYKGHRVAGRVHAHVTIGGPQRAAEDLLDGRVLLHQQRFSKRVAVLSCRGWHARIRLGQ